MIKALPRLLPWLWHGDGWLRVSVIRQQPGPWHPGMALKCTHTVLSPSAAVHFKVNCLDVAQGTKLSHETRRSLPALVCVRGCVYACMCVWTSGAYEVEFGSLFKLHLPYPQQMYSRLPLQGHFGVCEKLIRFE